MASNQNNDQGYTAVEKEYDFFNNNITDFEIINDIPNSFINPENNNDINNIKNNNDLKFEKQKKKLENFVTEIFKIIFKSRNKFSEFSSKSKRKLNETKKDDDDPFKPNIEELIEYDNLKAWDKSENSQKRKILIEFYLYENDKSDDAGSLRSVKINGKPKLLVERWKIKYKENYYEDNININNKNNFDEFMDTKMKLIEKDIISYSRILPLFNISKENNYFIEFKYNPKEKRNFVSENLTKKIKIKIEELFDFKLSLTYLKIRPENIEDLLKYNNNDFVIISKKKSRRRFLSDTYYKKSSNQLLKKESEELNNNINNDNNDNNIVKNDFIIENYFNDINNDNNNIIRKRRLSANEKDIKSKFYAKNFKRTISKSDDDSSEDNLSLVINESNNDDNKILNNNLNIDNITKDTKLNKNENKNQIKKDNSVRKCQTFRENSKNELKEGDNKINIEFKNTKIKQIVKEYKNKKKMMAMMPYYGDINCDKLRTFILSD